MINKCITHNIDMNESFATCFVCGGDGFNESNRDYHFSGEIETCWQCHGDGEIDWDYCELCEMERDD